MTDYRIVFAGTPAFAAGHLDALLQHGENIVAAYTQPDRPAGRGKRLLPSAVKQLAMEHQILVRQPPSLRNPEAVEELRALQPDVLIVVAYGLILPEDILAVPRLGCLNVHASLLPRWRGAAPIERALLAGDSETGITIMQMDAGLDTGAMLAVQSLPITAKDTGETLTAGLMEVGKHLLIDALEDLPELQAQARPQDDSQATYAAKLDKAESLIDFDQPAAVIDRQIRACAGRFPAYAFLGNDRIRLLEAQPNDDNIMACDDSQAALPGTIIKQDKQSFTVVCADSTLQVTHVQLPGKNPVAVRDLMNARPDLFAVGNGLRSAPQDPAA